MLGGRLDGRNNQKPHLLFPWIERLIRHPRILDAVESVIGLNILCWGSQLFHKRAGDPAFVSWHQDGTYWGLSSADVVTAWLALTPSTPESGCMRVIAGTHVPWCRTQTPSPRPTC
jgi:ectoine hydroxylase-related dioxygenase (phytanoyl-CoA dioxygenase family)